MGNMQLMAMQRGGAMTGAQQAAAAASSFLQWNMPEQQRDQPAILQDFMEHQSNATSLLPAQMSRYHYPIHLYGQNSPQEHMILVHINNLAQFCLNLHSILKHLPHSTEHLLVLEVPCVSDFWWNLKVFYGCICVGHLGNWEVTADSQAHPVSFQRHHKLNWKVVTAWWHLLLPLLPAAVGLLQQQQKE
jgi:hypothetical protein